MIQYSDVGLVDVENALKSGGRLSNGVVYAPNFQESKLYNAIQNEINDDPLKAYLKIHSGNFKKWFGDWENTSESASKVVDGNGEPLVVYHGTANYGFSDFDKSKLGANSDSNSSKKGFYFSSNPVVSWAYANGHAADVEFYSKEGGIIDKIKVINFPFEEFNKFKGRTIPKKIVKKKLLGLKKIILNNDEFSVFYEATYGWGGTYSPVYNEKVFSGMIVPRTDESVYKVFLNIRNMPHLDYSEDFVPKDEKGLVDIAGWSRVWKKFDSDLENLPNDSNGVMVDGLFDRKGFCIKEGGVERQYVAFEPNQIKSIDNNGNFSQGANIYR